MPLLHTYRPRLRPFLYSLLILFTLLTLFYFLCLCLGSVEFLHALLSKAGVSMGCRALSSFLLRIGCSGWIALAISFSVRGIAGETPYFAHSMLPANLPQEGGEAPNQPIGVMGPAGSSPPQTTSSDIEEFFDTHPEASSSAPRGITEVEAPSAPSSAESSSAYSGDSLVAHKSTSEEESFVTPKDQVPSTPEHPSSENSPKKDSLEFLLEGEHEFWHKVILRTFKDALYNVDPQGKIGKIPDAEILEALRVHSRLTKGEMEDVCQNLRREWPSIEEADRSSIYPPLWELLEKHRRPDI